MDPIQRNKRIRELADKILELQRQKIVYEDELCELQKERERERYNCTCVRSNKELCISTMNGLEFANRQGLGVGVINDLYSSRKGCPYCAGTGVVQ